VPNSPAFTSYIAIGDSFTEGVGDELPDGHARGWADFVALGMAAASDQPFRYANLAVRGRKLLPIVAEQVEPAIAQHPDLVSLNGGGNDIMRPRVSIEGVAKTLVEAADRVTAAGSHMLLLSGANPSAHLPLGGLIQRRGEELAVAVRAMLPRDGITFVDNWADHGLRDIRYWSEDRLHLNALGHARVASNVLTAFGIPVPSEWGVEEVAAAEAGAKTRRTADYYRRYVLPWVGRRLTGRSSGDGRAAKIAELTVVDPAAAHPL
jgi:lysophospholipase L1-like esterase